MRILPPPEHYAAWGNNVWVNPMFQETWTCSHPFTPPGHTCLYTIYDMRPEVAGETVLYVGITGNLRRRFKQHAADKPWWHLSENASIDCYDSWEDACDAELSLIRSLRPQFNVTGNLGPDVAADALSDCPHEVAVTCTVCQGVIWTDPDQVPDPFPQHQACNAAIVDAYRAGMSDRAAV